MDENEKKEPEEKDELKTISLKRYLWPDERLEKEKKKNRRLKTALVITACAAVLIGWLGGTLLPFGFLSGLRQEIGSGFSGSADKISTALDIMENDWYFGKDVKNLDDRLVDQAISGITTNKEDTHTEYMSKSEVKDFEQSINRDYVGIGVEFVSSNGSAIVSRVFKDSPAEKAGIQAGDILISADGDSLSGKSSDEIKKLVQGDEGTKVVIGVSRQGKNLSFEIKRASVKATTYGEMKDNGIAYLQLYQFGETTPEEVKAYLDDFKKENAKKLIIDLRDNGGGYLDSVSSIAACFLPKGSVVLQQEYKNGTKNKVKTQEEQYTDLGPIVILVNENTASAAEVLTLALKEQRDDVTLVGTTTYGKGSVQVTKQFRDGSAIKYTTCRWLSSKGTWVNGKGIKPDDEVKMDDVYYHTFSGMKKDESYRQDSVGDAVEDLQECLSYLGYSVDRKDGYFSVATQDALKQFEKDYGMSEDGVLSKNVYDAVYSRMVLSKATDTSKDPQLAKAQEVLNG